jgi:hypothetical protein
MVNHPIAIPPSSASSASFSLPLDLPPDYKPYNPPPFMWPEQMPEPFVWRKLRQQGRDLFFFLSGIATAIAWWLV